MNLMMHAVLWCVLGVALGAIALYRKYLCDHEDHLIHLHDNEANIINEQVTVGQKLENLSRVVRILGVVMALYAAVIAAAALWIEWNKF